ncbi:Tn7 transposase TnsA N-terminal domain-containing protein [Bacillus paramycoides]|uniref:Tn7 transposase TnsA N-terminal domain-containing protein n=1 Tax=Bacillus paramycoides TaxID=2026194 RepID=UPI00380821D7
MYHPIKMPSNKHYGSNHWVAFSYKIQRNVQLFSNLEYDNWIFVETDPNIVNFCEQPKKISYPLNGKTKHSIFDMWIQYSDGQEVFLEVKYSKELHPLHKKFERNINQIGVQREWCAANGFGHRVITEKDLQSNGLLLSNKKLILSLIKNTNEDSLFQQIIDHIIKVKTASFKELTTAFYPIPKDEVIKRIGLGMYRGNIKGPISKTAINHDFEVIYCET